MNRLSIVLESLKTTIATHPYLSGTAALFSLAIIVLRKVHYKFVVFPDVGGRHNHHNPHGYRHPREQRIDSDDIEVQSENGLILRGWYAKHAKPEAILIYYHENAGNIGGRLHFIKELMKRVNVNVLLVAYRGFSDSDGVGAPSQSQIMTDAEAIMRKGIELSKRDELPLMVLGRSLGGAASIGTLSKPQFKNSVKGLILENTFTSIFDVANNFIPKPLKILSPILWLIIAGSYNSIGRLSKVHSPILFIKGCKDTLIPKWQMDKLQEVYSSKKRQNYELLIPSGGHNDTWYEGGQLYFDTYKEFIGNCSKL